MAREVQRSVGGPDEAELISKEELLTLPPDEVLGKMGAALSDGLSEDEASSRLERYGNNEVVKRARRTGLLKFISYFRDPLSLILLLAGLVTCSPVILPRP